MIPTHSASPGANRFKQLADDGSVLEAAPGELREDDLPHDSHWQRLQKLTVLNNRWRAVCERMVARQ